MYLSNKNFSKKKRFFEKGVVILFKNMLMKDSSGSLGRSLQSGQDSHLERVPALTDCPIGIKMIASMVIV